VLNGMAWFRNLALGWWAGAVAMFVWHDAASVWISILLFAALLVAPGVALTLQARAAAR
jgi:hypothetical protein